MTAMDEVILVNEQDQETGRMGKLEAHQKGLLHRAFSIFIYNSKNQLLLQQRALDKYHSGGLWTNTCCSHPAPGESLEKACHRRLKEEMGFDTELSFLTSFIYKAELDKNLTEHEFDHVFLGTFEADPLPNKDEVSDWKFVDIDSVSRDILENPEAYTVWFRIIFSRVREHLLSRKAS